MGIGEGVSVGEGGGALSTGPAHRHDPRIFRSPGISYAGRIGDRLAGVPFPVIILHAGKKGYAGVPWKIAPGRGASPAGRRNRPARVRVVIDGDG